MTSHFHQFIKHYDINNHQCDINSIFGGRGTKIHHKQSSKKSLPEVIIDLSTTFEVENKPIHQTPTGDEPIDYKIFEEKKVECCDKLNINNKGIINGCSHLLRIICSLKYYQLIIPTSNKSNKSKGTAEFIDFCMNKYSQCLEDYIHLISVHYDCLQQICTEFHDKYHLEKCNNLKKCKSLQRHYGNRSNTDNAKNEYNFYIDIFDTIHVYIFHLEHIGMRSSIKRRRKRKKKDNNYSNCVDLQFGEIQKEISLKSKTCDVNIRRSKFNIVKPFNNTDNEIKSDSNDSDEKKEENSNSNSTWKKVQNIMIKYFGNKKKATCTGKKGENTFIDNMFTDISNNSNINKNTLETLQIYVVEHEYDTDCIVTEIDNDYGNINHVINNDIGCIESMKEFIKLKYDNNASSPPPIFSTGLVFWYWDYYKNVTDQEIKQQQSYSEQKHSGKYSIRFLYINRYYNSFKEEVLESGFIKIEQYMALIADKGNKYIETDKCKKIKCMIHSDRLHFNIPYNAALSRGHLYALILYCDFVDFCNHFSSSFRKMPQNETIESLTKRNSKYFYVSKYLRELVQYYGINGYSGEYINKLHERGPFYTGIPCIITIPSFLVRLNAPQSTSKRIEIPMRFCGNNGMIIQLNNHRLYTDAQNENFFNSSWISKYPEEEERIWFGGRYKIEIESIFVIETQQNYKPIINAFYKFDSLLSGQYVDHKSVTSMDIDIIRSAINHNHISKHSKFDSFMTDTFISFTKNKKEIFLNLHEIDQHSFLMNTLPEIILNHFEILVGLIMHSVQKQSWYTLGFHHSNKNLFKPLILELFPNLCEITIYSSYKSNMYGFNILSLLSILEKYKLPETLNKIIIKDIVADSYGDCGGLKFAFYSLKAQGVLNNKKKRNIHFVTKQGYKKKEDWLIIYLS